MPAAVHPHAETDLSISAIFELTALQEHRTQDFEQKLKFTEEDLHSKLQEERTRWEAASLKKTAELRSTQEQEIERIKKEFRKKLADARLTYVSRQAKILTLLNCTHSLQGLVANFAAIHLR